MLWERSKVWLDDPNVTFSVLKCGCLMTPWWFQCYLVPLHLLWMMYYWRWIGTTTTYMWILLSFAHLAISTLSYREMACQRATLDSFHSFRKKWKSKRATLEDQHAGLSLIRIFSWDYHWDKNPLKEMRSDRDMEKINRIMIYSEMELNDCLPFTSIYQLQWVLFINKWLLSCSQFCLANESVNSPWSI